MLRIVLFFLIVLALTRSLPVSESCLGKQGIPTIHPEYGANTTTYIFTELDGCDEHCEHCLENETSCFEQCEKLFPEMVQSPEETPNEPESRAEVLAMSTVGIPGQTGPPDERITPLKRVERGRNGNAMETPWKLGRHENWRDPPVPRKKIVLVPGGKCEGRLAEERLKKIYHAVMACGGGEVKVSLFTTIFMPLLRRNA